MRGSIAVAFSFKHGDQRNMYQKNETKKTLIKTTNTSIDEVSLFLF